MLATGHRATARVLLVLLLPVAGSLWVSLVFLLQIEARHRLQGMPGESSPLLLALYGAPVVLLVSTAVLLCWRAGRSGNGGQLLAAVALLVATAAAALAAPFYVGALQEFVTLPYRALTAG